jgi:hypothetical protein
MKNGKSDMYVFILQVIKPGQKHNTTEAANESSLSESVLTQLESN